ncbi:MAG: hypothetical protein CMF56_12890 [Leifsonia sp.]|nr:hypothetical protein [Leifsonia sp.]HAS32836.1 hypothetical protein [Microbacterium sp.]HBR89480.1 hypothetical protein [Microbacterium sp.]|tara:strand:- start:138 stop:368 length:231 start_codon:yes stop_codon:yes gene_type:complete
MPEKPAAWRTSEVVSYDVAVELVHTLTAELLQRSNSDAVSDIIDLRAQLEGIDSHDRAAVDEFVRALERRIDEVRG